MYLSINFILLVNQKVDMSKRPLTQNSHIQCVYASVCVCVLLTTSIAMAEIASAEIIL